MTLWRLTAAALALTPLAAQHHTSLSGIVRDPSDSAVPGASITAVQEETGFRRAAISGPAGGYLIDALQPGVYKLMVRKEGFRTLVRFGLKLDVAQPARFDFELQLGGSQETITVEGAQPAVNSADASVGTLVGRDRIARIPLNGRGLLSLLELAPVARRRIMRGTTQAKTSSPRTLSEMAPTATAAMPGWSCNTLSTSTAAMFSPERRMTFFLRSTK